MDNSDLPKPCKSGQCVVLIVEDEVIVRNVARMILESEGYFVLTADNNEEALYISQRYPGPIHIALVDAPMPTLHGVELTDRIVKQRPYIRIVMMSRIVSKVAGVAFLHKPFAGDELREKIRSVANDPVLIPPCRARKTPSTHSERQRSRPKRTTVEVT